MIGTQVVTEATPHVRAARPLMVCMAPRDLSNKKYAGKSATRGAFAIMTAMPKLLRLISTHLYLCATLTLLALSAMAIVLAFPATRGLLLTRWTDMAMLALLACLGCTTLRALWRKRWLSALFHLGAALLIVGGGLTAGYAKEGQIIFTDAPYAPPEYRQCLIDGDRVALQAFEMPIYPDGMPQQYITHLIFPEGTRTVSVNAPLRRKGWTYYQMSYQEVEGYYGEVVFNTILTVRKDPGVPFTFSGYGVIILAAFALAIREMVQNTRQRRREVTA